MVPDYTNFSKNFFNANHTKFDLATNEGCGKYTEAFVKQLRTIDPKVGHLKKNPGQTQYNGHANDAVLYPTGVVENGAEIYHAVDIIGRAEQPHPWVSEGGTNPDPEGQWSEDKNTKYKSSDWTAEPGNSNPGPHMVPYVPYDENGFQRLKNMLVHDYARRPQGADFDVSVWAGRYFHNCYMGPEGTPLGEDGALHRVKPELCAALGIPMDEYYG